MKRFAPLLGFLFAWLLVPALALTPSQRVLLFSGVKPVVAIDFTAAGFSPSSPLFTQNIAFSHTATGDVPTMFDATGTLTYGPNNLTTYSEPCYGPAWGGDNFGTGSVPTATPNYATDPLGNSVATRLQLNKGAGAGFSRWANANGYYANANQLSSVWIRSTDGVSTYTVAVRTWVTAKAVTVTGAWQQFYVLSTSLPQAEGLQVMLWDAVSTSNTADILIAQSVTSAVTYETTPRPNDQVVTTSAAYYGPRFPYAYNGSTWVPQGFLIEGPATNLYVNSQTPALQTVPVANATQYTISFYGTGSIAYSGAAAGTLSGTGANVLSSVTITSATTALVMAAPVGSVTNVQVETGAVATSRIITAGTSLTRNVDTVSATGPLAAAVAVGPSRTKTINEATGATVYTTYAAGAFPSTLPTGFYYQYIRAYQPGTNMAGVPN